MNTKSLNLKCALKASALAVGILSLAPSFAANEQPAVSTAERTRIEDVVHQYLLRKPEVIMEAVQSLQRKQYAQAEETVKKTQEVASKYANALFHQANDPVAGNPKGKVTVVEFFDYQCGHCVAMSPVITNMMKSNPDLRVVFKEFPIRGPVSDLASRAALAANKQGKYLELQHALLASKEPLSQENILVIAKEKGLDVEKLKKDMKSNAVSEQIKANTQLAQELKLFGTPAFFVGKTDLSKDAAAGSINYVPGRMDESQLQKLVDQNK